MFRPENAYYRVMITSLTKEIALYPGQLYIHTAPEPVRVWTLLGSCVSVALFNREARMGAICHAQLAQESLRGEECKKTCPNVCKRDGGDESRFRYLTCAFAYMVDELAKVGLDAKRLSAYVIGGFESRDRASDFFRVGQRNIETARELLSSRGIPILHEEAGGTRGRTLYFYPHHGELLFRYHGQKEYSRLPG